MDTENTGQTLGIDMTDAEEINKLNTEAEEHLSEHLKGFSVVTKALVMVMELPAKTRLMITKSLFLQVLIEYSGIFFKLGYILGRQRSKRDQELHIAQDSEVFGYKINLIKAIRFASRPDRVQNEASLKHCTLISEWLMANLPAKYLHKLANTK